LTAAIGMPSWTADKAKRKPEWTELTSYAANAHRSTLSTRQG
jgi:hypothetical protein